MMNRQRIGTILGLLLLLWTGSQAAGKARQAEGPNVTERVVYYPSVDQFGSRLTLSGRMTIPADKTPKGMLLVPHGTYTGNHEVPSNHPMYEEKLYGEQYVLVMPDYMGYGITRDSVHPYLCGELTAQHCVDMLLAVKDILDSMQVDRQSDSITIVGYSQGGAVALWTLKMLEERYADRLPVKACYAGSGPYDVASEFDVSVRKNKTGMPITVPMLVMGTSLGYDMHLNPKDYFTRATERMVQRFMVKKDVGFVDVWFRTPVHLLSHWLNKNGRDKSQPATRRVYQGLLRSSLVHYPVDEDPISQDIICPDWRPKAKTYIFHSTNDDVVDFQNSEHLRRCWGERDNVTYEFGKFGGHMKSYRLFATNIYNELMTKE